MTYIPTRRKFKGPILSIGGFEVGPKENPIKVIDENGVIAPASIPAHSHVIEEANIMKNGTPVIAVSAHAELVFEGEVCIGETIVIGDEVYEFGEEVAQGNIQVDISAGTPSSAGTILTFIEVPTDGQTLTVGEDVYEFDTDSNTNVNTIPVDVSSASNVEDVITALITASAGGTESVTFSVGNPGEIHISSTIDGSEGNGLTVSTTTTGTFDSPVLAGGTDATAEEAAAAIAEAITANTESVVTATAGTEANAHKVVINAAEPGTAGNEIALDDSGCENASFSDETLAGGEDPTTGVKGQILFDADNIYICIDVTGGVATWKAVALADL